MQQIIIVRGLLDYYLWKNYGISTFTLSSIKVFHFAVNNYSTGSPGLLPLENYGISTFTLSSIKVFHFAANNYSTGSPGLLPLEKLWN